MSRRQQRIENTRDRLSNVQNAQELADKLTNRKERRQMRRFLRKEGPDALKNMPGLRDATKGLLGDTDILSGLNRRQQNHLNHLGAIFWTQKSEDTTSTTSTRQPTTLPVTETGGSSNVNESNNSVRQSNSDPSYALETNWTNPSENNVEIEIMEELSSETPEVVKEVDVPDEIKKRDESIVSPSDQEEQQEQQVKQELESEETSTIDPEISTQVLDTISASYTVKPDDTLFNIATRHSVTLQQLSALNPHLFTDEDDAQGRRRKINGDLIYPGDEVVLPNGVEVVVDEDDRINEGINSSEGGNNIEKLIKGQHYRVENKKFVLLVDEKKVQSVKRLHIKTDFISDISDVAKLKGLEYFYWKQGVIDPSPLKDLRGLKSIRGNGIDFKNRDWTTNLDNLKVLNLARVSDNNGNLEWLEHLTQLESLRISSSQLTDIGAISALTNLKSLSIQNASLEGVGAIEALSNLENLETLRLDDNKIEDIRPLENLTGLRNLRLNGNKIKDITPLARLTNLNELWLLRNDIMYIEGLDDLTARDQDTQTINRNNKYIDVLTGLTVGLYLEHEIIEELNAFAIKTLEWASPPNVMRRDRSNAISWDELHAQLDTKSMSDGDISEIRTYIKYQNRGFSSGMSLKDITIDYEGNTIEYSIHHTSRNLLSSPYKSKTLGIAENRRTVALSNVTTNGILDREKILIDIAAWFKEILAEVDASS